MIVPMSKITLICMRAHRAATLERLRKLECLHIQPVTPPEAVELDDARRNAEHARQILAALPAASQGLPPAGIAPEKLVAAVAGLLREKRELAERLEQCRQEEQALLPFGDFDPDALKALAEKGVYARLYYLGGKQPLPAAPVGAVLRELARSPDGVWFVLFAPQHVAIKAEERAIPARSLAAVRQELQAVISRQAELAAELEKSGGARKELEKYCVELEDRVRFLEVQTGMGAVRDLIYLQGFCPNFKILALRTAAQEAGWALMIREPSETDPVPTLIKNSIWVRPIKAMFDLLGILPGYREMDVSAVFLVFFSIFVAMLVSDAVYGLLLLGLTAIMQWKWKSAPPALIPLLRILGTATVIWGVLTGSYMGIQNLPAALKALRIEWLLKESNMIHLCFLIGSVHLTIAHAWNGLLQRRSTTAIAQIGWIGLAWTMYYTACYFVIGRPMPGFVLWLFGFSIAAVVLFTTPLKKIKTEWTNYCVLPFTIIGNFGDVVSYMRLYLVGSASTTLILAFNDLVLGNGIKSVWAGLIAAVILFLVHLLNIALCGLAVLVHGVRLNALEFSSHLGIQWLGIRYKPFASGSQTEEQPK